VASANLKEVSPLEDETQNKKKDGLAEEKKKFRITDRRPDSTDKLRRELAFDVEWDDPESKETKIGVFRAQRLTIGGVSKVRVMEARLNEGQALDGYTAGLHYALAYLKIALIEFPDWWKPEEFFDDGPVGVVLDHVRHWESSFR